MLLLPGLIYMSTTFARTRAHASTRVHAACETSTRAVGFWPSMFHGSEASTPSSQMHPALPNCHFACVKFPVSGFEAGRVGFVKGFRVLEDTCVGGAGGWGRVGLFVSRITCMYPCLLLKVLAGYDLLRL